MIIRSELVSESSESYLNIFCEDFLNIWTSTSDHLVKEVPFLCVTIFLWIEINGFLCSSISKKEKQKTCFTPF